MYSQQTLSVVHLHDPEMNLKTESCIDDVAETAMLSVECD